MFVVYELKFCTKVYINKLCKVSNFLARIVCLKKISKSLKFEESVPRFRLVFAFSLISKLGKPLQILMINLSF